MNENIVAITLRLEKDLIDRLLEQQNRGVSRTALIRQAIMLHLAELEKGAKSW